MIKVLYIMGCSDYGGISTVVLNYYKNMNRDKIHFDLALKVDFIGHNAKELQKLGAKVYFLPLKNKGIKEFGNALIKILKENHYDAIHTHEGPTAYIALRIAKKMGVKCRVAHAHTTAPSDSFKSELKRLSGVVLNYHYATAVIGCGQLAGERVFGKLNMHRRNAYVLPNAVDTSRFAFDPSIRKEVREELGVTNNYVVGMVGRLSLEKNHAFALRVIKFVHKQYPELKLVIVGDGEEQEHIRKLIIHNNMESYVDLLGRRLDVNRLYQAFDCIILPSIHEGFPVVSVEAMSSGLPVLLSDTITKELSFGSCVKYLSIKSISPWVNAIGELIKNESVEDRVIRQNEPKDNGFDIKDTSKMLESIYLKDLGK